jgi:hypothetical protein
MLSSYVCTSKYEVLTVHSWCFGTSCECLADFAPFKPLFKILYCSAVKVLFGLRPSSLSVIPVGSGVLSASSFLGFGLFGSSSSSSSALALALVVLVLVAYDIDYS